MSLQLRLPVPLSLQISPVPVVKALKSSTWIREDVRKITSPVTQTSSIEHVSASCGLKDWSSLFDVRMFLELIKTCS